MMAKLEADQISRAGLAWLLIAQAMILAPHAFHAPLWLWGVWLPVVIWRWQIFRGAWGYPGITLKVILVAICAVGLLLAVQGRFGTQAMVCLLLAGFILKLLELRRRRDFLVLSFLGYFVIATQLLFFSEVYAALYALVCVLLLSTALLAVNQSINQQGKRSFKLAAAILLQAVPLMLLLFMVTPRLGPLWAVPLNTAAAKTGMSDSLSPGDISELMQSDQLAFRVTFTSDNPQQNQLYWRGLVLSHFDGRRWSQNHLQTSFANIAWSPTDIRSHLAKVELIGEVSEYEVIMEPSYQPWLFALNAPAEWDERIGLGPDIWLQNRRPVSQRFQYRVRSHLDYRLQRAGLAEQQWRGERGLPRDFNPQTRQTALAWMSEEGSPEALIRRLLQYFNQNFTYTLQPGALGHHSVDEFLWQTRQGFCEHFASSFVFFMRAAGVPARVVVGYQGGSYNARENYWMVRQRDAHAWAEVWLEGRGWVRIDPTAAVAPDRIERGIDYSLNEADAELLGNALSRNFGLIADLAMRWDAFNYHWSRWVLNYDARLQQQLFGQWIKGVDLWKLTLVCLGIAGAIVLVLAIWLLRSPTSNLSLWDRHYRRFEKKLARAGLPRLRGEAPRDYAARAVQTWPDQEAQLHLIARLYELAAFSDNPSVLPKLGSAIRQLRVRPAQPSG